MVIHVFVLQMYKGEKKRKNRKCTNWETQMRAYVHGWMHFWEALKRLSSSLAWFARACTHNIELVKGVRGRAKARASYTSTTNSGLTKEKPGNSVWSRFMMKSLSVGVNRGGSLVNSESKLEMSRGPLYNEENEKNETSISFCRRRETRLIRREGETICPTSVSKKF